MVRQLYPNRCPVCDRVLFCAEESGGGLVCPECDKKLQRIRQPFCLRCGRKLKDAGEEYCLPCKKHAHGFVQGRGVWVYGGAVRPMLYRYKYSNRRDYTSFFAEAALQLHREWIMRIGIEVLVPVPLHWSRKRRRGYNQAELFAGALSERTGIPMDASLVQRVRRTAPQKKLSGPERKNNLKNAFKISKNVVQYKKVLLIDDIYTTGSTMDAVASVLRRAGVGGVYFLCISIGM